VISFPTFRRAKPVVELRVVVQNHDRVPETCGDSGGGCGRVQAYADRGGLTFGRRSLRADQRETKSERWSRHPCFNWGRAVGRAAWRRSPQSAALYIRCSRATCTYAPRPPSLSVSLFSALSALAGHVLACPTPTESRSILRRYDDVHHARFASSLAVYTVRTQMR
jgi:hypothetical protein